MTGIDCEHLDLASERGEALFTTQLVWASLFHFPFKKSDHRLFSFVLSPRPSWGKSFRDKWIKCFQNHRQEVSWATVTSSTVDVTPTTQTTPESVTHFDCIEYIIDSMEAVWRNADNTSRMRTRYWAHEGTEQVGGSSWSSSGEILPTKFSVLGLYCLASILACLLSL